jgi:hypothetical protein
VTVPLLAVCMLLLGAQSVSAQRLDGPAPSELFAYGARPTPASSRDTVFKVVEPTHWKLGLVLGAAAGGLALGYVGYGLCHDDSEIHQSCFGPAVGGAIFGAAAGGTIGGLIGGAFRKHEPADTVAIVQ